MNVELTIKQGIMFMWTSMQKDSWNRTPQPVNLIRIH